MSALPPDDREVSGSTSSAPAGRDRPQPSGAEQTAFGTNGENAGADGGRPWRLVTAAAVATVAVVVIVNLLSRLHERPEFANRGLAWRIYIDEVSAGVTACLLIPVALAIYRRVPPERARWRRFAWVQAATAFAFSLVHTASFIAVRVVAYSAFGERYRFGGLDQLLYEVRKDLLAYGLAIALCAAALQLLRSGGAASAPPPTTSAPPAYLIRDGARVVRVLVTEIVAAKAAGNYVEFHLADERTLLARATLAQVETELSVHGLVRTHRSWLVNPARLREISSTGSGDRRLTLEAGVVAPLSRRFEAALEQLAR